MAKVTEGQLQEELKKKRLTLVSDYEDYKNLGTPITVSCLNGHEIQTNLKTIRSSSFTCPVCVGQATKGFNKTPVSVPSKKGYRVIGFDNASHKMGVSIFDDGKLVYYGLLTFNQGTAIQRLNKIRDLLENVIIPVWEPDFIQIEDIQHQASYQTYEVLIKLVGIFELAADRYQVPLHKDRSSVWRSHFGINKRNREVEKQLAIDLVKEMYDIETTDDVAEAILINKFRIDMIAKSKIKDLF